ncbi:MAG: glycoside hydrolase family 3 C-terminal domain-containing protein [Bacteroidales bacterium]|jgi:beta-glucosidase|nr:glycoside hydrolase family 3 C-terminal domain-containing protein [Bacteroidales bacterium]MCI2121504.1 glycoside hydrolase family 3 C-terminal domain-containing protein [Bacteroidales bacterium]MCI2145131.1 glycoside hydrolase family 3 C-terminal domain-containing protein [Bacteroidales bacterium]
MKSRVLILSTILLSALLLPGCNPGRGGGNAGSKPAYLDDSKPLEERVEDALARMTLEEKVAMCHAQSKFSSPGVPRLGIPEVWCDDGPHGIRAQVYWDRWDQAGWTDDSCMAFPALTCLAASWDTSMARLYGKSIGEEARYRNKDVLLAPGVNICRTPLGGRNFEYMGEDPFLISSMAVPYIQGVQSNGVAACAKHFVLNDQEKYRHQVDVYVDDRALNEIYLAPFKAAVEGGVWAIMPSYNLYRGSHLCENGFLLSGVLRDRWKFDGVSISDWGGVSSTDSTALAGLDMEFGTWTDGMTEGESGAYDKYYFAAPFLSKLKSGEIPVSVVDSKVRNILRLIFRTSMNRKRGFGSFDSPEHSAAGLKIAESGIVLLKNDGDLLPVDLSKVKKILVVGENATKRMTIGGGSSSLKARYEISPLEGIKERAGADADVTYMPGYSNGMPTYEDPMGTVYDVNVNHLSPERLRAEAVEAARNADIVLYFGGLNKNPNQDSEGDDRLQYELPYGQDKLIYGLAEANPNLVVVLISGNAVAMPWLDSVPALMEGWYCGSEAGHALAAVIFGDVDPSGKLPFTIDARLEDYGPLSFRDPSVYPGIVPGRASGYTPSPADTVRENYREGIYVGYRWNEAKGIKPLFPFGYGLSYTSFEYGKAKISSSSMKAGGKIKVTVPVTNTGSREGSEVVQMYIHDCKSSTDRPYKELKGFSKISLEPGETKKVSFEINEGMLRFYDTSVSEKTGEVRGWHSEPGDFDVLIGTSSASVPATARFTLK